MKFLFVANLPISVLHSCIQKLKIHEIFFSLEGEKSEAMADWMSELPVVARDKPIMTLAIPGLQTVFVITI